ncbi:hypothetical protein RvY_06913 [Ramazzottius varieornatus]|uniref:Uncharacterized protein n=1 Tax=Ramazzottius varieornatus TaxID=947166 RepID=A0A1D1V6I7_RAMVA|nr:hypothetical protein RvY_06913 [Ramazzottius varieornatus]
MGVNGTSWTLRINFALRLKNDVDSSSVFRTLRPFLEAYFVVHCKTKMTTGGRVVASPKSSSHHGTDRYQNVDKHGCVLRHSEDRSTSCKGLRCKNKSISLLRFYA